MPEDFARLVNRAAPYAKPAVAIVIALCAVAYAAAIVFGWIEKEQRIDGTSGALIAGAGHCQLKLTGRVAAQYSCEAGSV